jgi:hypothetical protein
LRPAQQRAGEHRLLHLDWHSLHITAQTKHTQSDNPTTPILSLDIIRLSAQQPRETSPDSKPKRKEAENKGFSRQTDATKSDVLPQTGSFGTETAVFTGQLPEQLPR